MSAPPLPPLPADLAAIYGQIIATPNAGPENGPVTLCLGLVEALQIADALRYHTRTAPFSRDMGREDYRDILMALRKGLEQYPERCEHVIETVQIPPRRKDWEPAYRDLAKLVAPHADTHEKVMQAARNLLVQLDAVTESREMWRKRAEERVKKRIAR